MTDDTAWRSWTQVPAAVVPVLVGTACALGVPHRDEWAITVPHTVPVLVPYSPYVGGIDLGRMVAVLVVALAVQLAVTSRRAGAAGWLTTSVLGLAGLVTTLVAAGVQTLHLSGAGAIERPIGGHGPKLTWLTGYSWYTWGMAVAVGCMCAALIVAAGPVDGRSRALYAALMVVPFVLVPVVAVHGGRPAARVALAALPLAAWPVVVVLAGRRGPDLDWVRGATGAVLVPFGLLLTAGLVFDAW